MTELRKTVARRTATAYDHHGRRVVVSLEPGDVIALRWERTRTTFRAPIHSVMRTVIRWNVDAERAARKATRKARREAGL
jgi:hypothetical protein